jgi:hypothetical protein
MYLYLVAAGEVLGHLCSTNGPDVYSELEPMLISGIKDNLERDQDLITEHPQLMEKLSGRQSPDPAEIERVCNVITNNSQVNLRFFILEAKVSKCCTDIS